MARRFDTVSFLSDLGVADETVGVVKAVVRDLAPHAVVLDLTHEVAPYDVRAGSLALARAIGHVPSGVVLVSVDAGPAATRPLVAIEVAGGEGVLVGPDNGVLAPAVAMTGGAERAVLLTDPRFHLPSAGGLFVTRDVLAAVAAHLCNGIDLSELGEPVDPDELLPGVVPLPREAPGGGVVTDVLWIDRFGNCQLNVGPDDLAPWGDAPGARLQLTTGDVVRMVERSERITALGAGSLALLTDPYGMLAVALQRRSAAEELGLSVGDQVTLSPLPEGDRGPSTPTPVALRPKT